MRAEPRLVPRGIRLQAQPARKAGKMEGYGGWGRVIFDGEQYRTWYIEVNGVSMLGSGSVAHTDTITSVAICGIKSQEWLPLGRTDAQRNQCAGPARLRRDDLFHRPPRARIPTL